MKKEILLIFSVLASAISATASDFEFDGIYYNIISPHESTCEVTYDDQNYNLYSDNINIPSTVTYSGKTFYVKSIGDNAFKGCKNLNSVSIPNSITSIGLCAFQYCTNLASLEIPNSVTIIGDGAFSSCQSLTSIEIPNSVISIGNGAFTGCYELMTFAFPNSVTSVNDGIFQYCSNLESVTIPNSITSLGEEAFSECVKLSSIDLPNSVISIGNDTFNGCESLTSVVIPNSVISIGRSAFTNCSGLLSVVIPNSINSIEFGTFSSCSNLTSISVPNSVTEIGDYAFAGCSKLSSILIPDCVTSIGENAFWGCNQLISIEIPNSITSIEKCVFYECKSLTSVTIPDKVTSIKESAFQGCSNLKSIRIGTSVTSIGAKAFYACNNLKEIISLPLNPPSIWSNNTFDGVPMIEAIVKVPNESVEAYKSTEYWKAFWNIIGIDGEEDVTPETKQCAEPTIELVNGELLAYSATEGAICYTSITSEDFKGVDSNNPIELTGIYNVSSYAHANGYLNSETVTAKVVWANPTLDGAGVLSMEAKKAVLIRVHNGNIIVSGTERGESIRLYTIDGIELSNVSADDNETIIHCNLNKGEIVIVTYGGKSVKILM